MGLQARGVVSHRGRRARGVEYGVASKGVQYWVASKKGCKQEGQ